MIRFKVVILLSTCNIESCDQPEGTLTLRATNVLSLLNSRVIHVIVSAFARRISIFVDRTWYVHFSGIICLSQGPRKPNQLIASKHTPTLTIKKNLEK